MASNMFALGLLLSTLTVLFPVTLEKSVKQAPKPTKQKVAVCFLPKQSGMCQGNYPRYYFDQKTKKCVKFIYGGCQGNQNNFMTKKECIYKCATVSPQANVNKTSNATPTKLQQQKPCLLFKKKAIAGNSSFVPECDKNGDYQAKQCWQPNSKKPQARYCWCVDKKGRKVREVIKLPNNKETCTPPKTKREQTECLSLVNTYHKMIDKDVLAKIYVPQCDDYSGLYNIRQCFQNFCWCVDRFNGRRIKDAFGHEDTLKCP